MTFLIFIIRFPRFNETIFDHRPLEITVLSDVYRTTSKPVADGMKTSQLRFLDKVRILSLCIIIVVF